MKNCFVLIAVMSGVLSAVFWIVSAFVKVKADGAPRHDSWGGGSVQDGEGNDIVRTLKRQSKWNSAAAIAASIAAVSQAISTYL